MTILSLRGINNSPELGHTLVFAGGATVMLGGRGGAAMLVLAGATGAVVLGGGAVAILVSVGVLAGAGGAMTVLILWMSKMMFSHQF